MAEPMAGPMIGSMTNNPERCWVCKDPQSLIIAPGVRCWPCELKERARKRRRGRAVA